MKTSDGLTLKSTRSRNPIIAYSSKGVLHEVDGNGTLLQEWTFGLGLAFGYVDKRSTLYGRPPR